MEDEILVAFEDIKTLHYFGLLMASVFFIILVPIYIWVLRIEKGISKK
jgi:hypothetical protein